MPRYAILIGNSTGFEKVDHSKALLTTQLSDFENALAKLGDHAFTPVILKDLNVEEAQKRLRQKLESFRLDCDLLLFYYCGHGVYRNNDVYMFFKNSDSSVDPTMISFSEVVRDIVGYGFGRAVYILDCCYAGAGMESLPLSRSRARKSYLMASAIGTANTVAPTTSSIGIFTEQLIHGFRDPAARKSRPVRDVTFRSLFDYAKEKTEEIANGQEPWAIDGGLGDDLFLQQETEIKVLPYLNEKAHRKTSYYKIYLLATYLAGRSFRSAETLYEYAKSKNDPSFHTPVRTKRGATAYVFMSLSAFLEYVVLLRDLGALDVATPELSTEGVQLVSGGGARFNAVIWNLVEEYWRTCGFTVSDVLDAISYRVQFGEEPTARAVWRFLFQRRQTRLSPARMRKTLDLAGYAGAIPYCSEKTFFPVP